MFVMGMTLEPNTVDAPVASQEVIASTSKILEKTPEQLVREEFADAPIMIEVSRCESHWRQFDEYGNVLRGKVNNKDVGLFQINEFYHLATAEKMGINLYTVEGNITYARILYTQNGTRDWNWSKPCWGVHA